MEKINYLILLKIVLLLFWKDYYQSLSTMLLFLEKGACLLKNFALIAISWVFCKKIIHNQPILWLKIKELFANVSFLMKMIKSNKFLIKIIKFWIKLLKMIVRFQNIGLFLFNLSKYLIKLILLFLFCRICKLKVELKINKLNKLIFLLYPILIKVKIKIKKILSSIIIKKDSRKILMIWMYKVIKKINY
jgi:hypothetical protein